MTDMNVATIPSAVKASAGRYLACLRPQDILVLQGSPLLGAAFAIGRPSIEDAVSLAILAVANVLLVAHIFLLNDWSGLATDRLDPDKAARVFAARGVRRKDMAILSAGLLIGSLLLFLRLGPLALSLAIAITFLSALYSMPLLNWKGKPILSSVAHLGGGILHFLLGYSLADVIDGRGVAIATFFGLIFAAGHLTQEVRDHRGDSINGIRTNAVVFGPKRVFAASLALFSLAQVLLLVLSLRGVLQPPFAAIVLLLPLQLFWSLRTLRQGLTYASVCRLQTRYRALYAAIGAAMWTELLIVAFAG